MRIVREPSSGLLWITALHEAGHAVSNFMHDGPNCYLVTVERDGTGVCYSEQIGAVATLSGMAAEEHIGNVPWLTVQQAGRRDLKDFQYHYPDLSLRAYYREALRFVEVYRDQIVKVAFRLVFEPEGLDGTELFALLAP